MSDDHWNLISRDTATFLTTLMRGKLLDRRHLAAMEASTSGSAEPATQLSPAADQAAAVARSNLYCAA
jgi:hypothetical protein